MSHFAVYECKVSNLDYVKRALGEMELGYIEHTTITDWSNRKLRVALAVVKNERVLPLGWTINKETNQLELQADWFVLPFSQKDFTDKISQLHSKYQVIETCKENRWHIEEDDITINDKGEIEIIATQFV